jgi:hypothetical protein
VNDLFNHGVPGDWESREVHTLWILVVVGGLKVLENIICVCGRCSKNPDSRSHIYAFRTCVGSLLFKDFFGEKISENGLPK